jgi:hypothetical protein
VEEEGEDPEYHPLGQKRARQTGQDTQNQQPGYDPRPDRDPDVKDAEGEPRRQFDTDLVVGLARILVVVVRLAG